MFCKCFRSADINEILPQLVRAAKRAHISDGHVDLNSPSWQIDCMTLLSCIDWAARALGATIATRGYRAGFTSNYRALFPDQSSRLYRVDIFEAALKWNCTRWVNGERFDLGADAAHAAEVLQTAWASLYSNVIAHSTCSEEESVIRTKKPQRCDRPRLKSALATFDAAWGRFEQRYILELMKIEASARSLVVIAIQQEERLKDLESPEDAAGRAGPAVLSEQRRLFLVSVARLNSASNLRWKGLVDRGYDVLEVAIATLEQCQASAREGENAQTQLQRLYKFTLASSVVECFESLRAYLRSLTDALATVHPHLCNNDLLVSHSCSWTEAWELAARFIESPALVSEMCDLIASIHVSRRRIPCLAAMFEECDAELFMVLPRLVWLWFLSDPSSKFELMLMLFPHHFKDYTRPQSGYDSQIERFASSFERLVRALAGIVPDDNHDARGQRLSVSKPSAALQWLIARVVAGPSVNRNTSLNTLIEATMSNKEAPAKNSTEIVSIVVSIESFVHELEHWSIELQRHQPEDWCQCSAVLIRCLSKETELDLLELLPAESISSPRPA